MSFPDCCISICFCKGKKEKLAAQVLGKALCKSYSQSVGVGTASITMDMDNPSFICFSKRRMSGMMLQNQRVYSRVEVRDARVIEETLLSFMFSLKAGRFSDGTFSGAEMA